MEGKIKDIFRDIYWLPLFHLPGWSSPIHQKYENKMGFCFYLQVIVYLSFLFQLDSKLIIAFTLLEMCAITTAIIQFLCIAFWFTSLANL